MELKPRLTSRDWKETASVPVSDLEKIDVEKLEFRDLRDRKLQLRAIGDEGELDVMLPWTQKIGTPDVEPSIKVVAVLPTAQTTSVEHMGDAADDPAIWIHPTDRSRSLVLGTANQKDGLFVQYQIIADGRNGVSARKVREFRLTSQPEGCVVNDRTGDLFVGEEEKGVYVLPLSPKSRRGSAMSFASVTFYTRTLRG